MIKLLSSFRFAWQGISYCVKTQLNYRIHLFFILLVIVAGIAFSIGKTEWCLVIVCCILVLILEMINTSIEYLSNRVTQEFSSTIKIVKDVAAGAVLVAAVGSIIIGSIIFIPKILFLFQ